MYWIPFILLVIIISLLLISFIYFAKDGDGEAGTVFVVMGIFSLILWGFIEFKTYKTGTPKDIKPKEISILKDKEIAILRYNGFQESYTSKKDYDAISDSTFVLQETTEYNIQGEENGKTYKLVIK